MCVSEKVSMQKQVRNAEKFVVYVVLYAKAPASLDWQLRFGASRSADVME